MLSRGREIDVVDTDTSSADDLEASRGGFEDLATDFGGAADNQRIAERDLGAELLGAEVVRAIDISEFLEEGEASLAELLGDEDSGLGVHGQHHEAGNMAAGERGGGNAERREGRELALPREGGGLRVLGGE